MAAIAVAIVLLLGGCRAQQSQAPATDDLLPASFSAQGERALPQQWWEHLNDPALNHLIEAALLNSPTLAATWDRLDQAQAIARREGADLGPDLNANAGASADRRGTTTGNNRGERGGQSLTLGLQASYEADLWGRIEPTADAARLDADASRAQVQAAAITLSASVATTWYQLFEARGQTALLAEQIKINEQALELIELRFRRGVSPLSDVLRQRQLLEARRGQHGLAQRDEQMLVH